MRKLVVGAISAAVIGVLSITAVASATVHSSTPTLSSSLSTQDKLYLTFSAQSSLAEIASGQAAQAHSSNGMVQMFGQMMVRDHSFQYQTETRLARSLHQSIPNVTDPIDGKILALAGQLYGNAFDCAYLSQDWTAHQNNISMTKLEIVAGSNLQVRAYAARYLHTLNVHATVAAHDLNALTSCR